MGVLAIWRYPVKAMIGEPLAWADVTAGGLEGDRRWVVADARTGERIANKRGPTDPRLRACRATIDAAEQLVVTLPDGTQVSGVAAVEAALSNLLERRITLVERSGDGGGYMDTRGHQDFAPVHVMTRQSLEHMRRAAGGDWDARRFRPNLLLDDPAADGLSEPAMIGTTLRAPSGLRLSVALPTPRCVVPTRENDDLPAHPRLLKELAGHSRWGLGPIGRPVCLGTYAEVPADGRVAVGERLAIDSAPSGDPRVRAADTVARLLSDG